MMLPIYSMQYIIALLIFLNYTHFELDLDDDLGTFLT